MRTLVWALCALCLPVSVFAQPPTKALSFKGNYLGMPLAEFKANNGGFTVWVNTGKPGLFGQPQKKNARQVSTPLCTDELRDFPGDSRDLEDGEVLCNPAPGSANPDARTVLGNLMLEEVVYRFHDGRLYAIKIRFMDREYRAMALAFREKYGDSPSVSAHAFQNGFGARWKGEELMWHSGKQMILLMEGSGNGPAQDALAVGSTALICDTSLAPRGTNPSPVDF